MRIAVAGALLFFASMTGARANPPPDADMSLAPWFHSLMQPGTGMSCCSIADCRPTDYRIRNGHYEALIRGDWKDVPAEVVLHRSDNPTGRAVVCYSPNIGIMCFIKGPET